MEKNVNKKQFKVTIGVLIIFIGICILSSTYYNTKKFEVFDEMNELYYEQVVNLDEEVDEVEEEITTTTVSTPSSSSTTTKVTTTRTTIDYSKYYVGYIKINKIKLQRGFLDINSKYNNVNRNIYVVPSSNYPNVKNGNLILASHSGSSSISYFKNLYKLKVGDDVMINYDNKDYHYKITKIYTDTKDGDVTIKRNKNKTTLTLITCTKGDKKTQTVYICELV